MRKQATEQPSQASDDKIVSILTDFYGASGKQISEQRIKEATEHYKGDYQKMVTELYQAAGKEITPEKIKALEKHYKLIEDAPVTELPKEVIDFNATVDEVEDGIARTEALSGSFGADSPRMGSPAGFDDIKSKALEEYATKKEDAVKSFDFKPISLKEVVNTLGKGRDDIDEVSQTSKLYLEKYTKRMRESFEKFEENQPDSVKNAVDPDKLSPGDKAIYDEWERRFNILNQQEELNKSTIYKKDESKRLYNNVAREAKDNNQDVREAILKEAERQGDTSEWVTTLANKGWAADKLTTEGTKSNDTWVSTSVFNTIQRVQNTLSDTWRGVKEAFDLWNEDSTVYNEAFMKEFDQYLEGEVDEDIKRLMWGTNKSKYDGDIREKKVDVDGVKVILDDKGNAVGIRKPNGNMSWNFNEDEIKAIQKYEANKDELKEKAYHDFRVGTLGAKGTQVATDMIPIIAATAATGGAGGTLLGTYAVTYGDFYEQQFAKTGSVGNATAFASAATAMTSMLEGLGGIEGSIIRNASKRSLDNAITDAAAEVASRNVINGTTVTSALMKHLGKQMLEETGIEVAQSLGEAAAEITFNGDTNLTWKELEEIIILTPFATGPITGALSANSFKNFGIENIKIAAKKKDVFNKLVDDWVGAAKTPEQKEKRQKEADFKKGVVEELSQSLTAVEELKIIDKDISSNLLKKSIEVVEKKQQIANTKSDQARGVYENDLAKLQSEVQEIVQKGYDAKKTLDDVAAESKRQNEERDARIAEREKEEKAKLRTEAREAKAKELDEVKNDPEMVRLNIAPDNDKTTVRAHTLPTAADFEAVHDEGVDDSEVGESTNNNSLQEGSKIIWNVFGNESSGEWTVGKKVKTRGGQEAVELYREVTEKGTTNTHIETHVVPLADLGKVESNLTLKVAALPTEFNDQGEITTDAVVVDSEGNTKAQFTVFGDTPVAGAIEVDAMVDEDIQGQGIATKAYQAIANKSGKPIIPASINRDYRGEKNSSTLSKAAALFWKKSLDNGTAEEVEVTTRDGKVIRTVAILPEGFKSTETVKKIEDTGVEDFNVESEKFEQPDEVEVDMENGTFVLIRRGVPVLYKIIKFLYGKKKNGLKDVKKNPENYGYHGGNLQDKSDYLTDAYRGDLPYTGYYFYGDQERALDRGNRSTGKAEARAVNFTLYNLIKVTSDQYTELKFALKGIEDALLKGNKDKLVEKIETLKQWVPEVGNKLSAERIEELWSEWSKKRDEEFSKPRINYRPNSIERFETVILKDIGYEGVDARGTTFDSSAEGSVIFDLKPESIVDLYADPNEVSNKNEDITSIEVTDPTGNKKIIRSENVVAEVVGEKIIHENKLVENEIQEEELLRAIADSGERDFEQISSDESSQDSESARKEQKFREGSREDIRKQNVNYKGTYGKLLRYADGPYYVLSPDGDETLVERGESDLTNEEVGITRGKTNEQVLKDTENSMRAELSAVEKRIDDLHTEIDVRIPDTSVGDFQKEIGNVGGNTVAIRASKIAKIFEKYKDSKENKHRVPQPTMNAVGKKRIKEMYDLIARRNELNKNLSNKNLRELRVIARKLDTKAEVKQLKAERKAKEKAARKRSEEAAKVVEPTPEPTVEQTPKKTEPKAETKKPEPTKKESTDVIPDTVWDTYVNTGVVPDAVMQGIADHVQSGTATKMSARQFAIFTNKTSEINKILAGRDAEGSYPRKTAAKATDDAMSIIDRRNKQIGNVLKSIGFTQDKINDTITVFNQVAKRWAKRNNRPIEDFYTDVFKGIEVADLGEGRRGKTVPLDGGYIIQLSSSANIATPVHELAHIFQNFLTNAEIKAVLDWAGTTDWTRNTSEMFADGFVKWLEKSDTVPDLDAFKRFKEWLKDLYDGIVRSREVLPTFTTELKKLYTSILSDGIEQHTTDSYNKAIGKNNIMLDRMRKEGIQFKKAVFDDVLRKVEVTARGLQRFAYMPRKMQKLAQQAVEENLTDPIKALEYTTEVMEKMTQDPEYLPSMSVQQAIGYGYALTQMEAAYERVLAKRKKSPGNKELLQLQDELSRNIQDLSQVLTIARSHAGLQLRIGSHRFTQDLYSPAVMKIQAINRLNRKLGPEEEAQIERHSKYIQASMKQFKDAAENLDEATRQELMSMAEQLVSEQFKNSPFMKEALKAAKTKTPRQRSTDLKTEFEKLSKMLSEKPDMLLDKKVEGLFDEDTDDTKFFKSLRSFISLIIASDENIDSFEKLSDAMKVYFPTINQDKLLSVIVWTDPAYQKAKAEELAGTASIIKKESALLDKLRTYLTETYQDVERHGNKKVYPARLKELERLISQIQTLAATDYTIDNETFIEATIHLDSLQSIYAGLTLDKIDFSSPNLEDMISKVREYETARKLGRKEKQLRELEGIIEALNEGTYEGSLSELVPDNPQRYVDERLQIVADKIGISKEVLKTFKEKSNKLEIIKRLGSLLQKGDKGETLKDFNTIYEAIKAELPEITKKEVYDAILYKVEPKKVEELLKSARANMNAEVKAIEKLENFLKKEPSRSKAPDTKTALQAELEKIVGEVRKFAEVRYENLSDYKVDDLKTKLRNIIDNYEGVLNGSITTMSVKDIIEEVGRIKDQELNESLKDRSTRAKNAVDKTLLEVDSKDNIFELVPELLPKIITTDNQRLKRILSDEIKHERLIRVNKMFKVVKDLVSSGGELNSTELSAITKFLEIEKKSKDMKPELIRLNRQVYLQRAAFNDWLEANYTATNTAAFKALVNTPRVLTLAADISFVMYQGGVMLYSNPIIAAKAFGKMAQSAFNHKAWQNQLADIQMSPFYAIAISSGLKLVDETSLTLEEELQLTSILERIPYLRVLAKTIRRFGERVYSSYMNHLRLNTFIEGLKKLDAVNGGYINFDENYYGRDDLGFTQEHREVAKKVAAHINMHTGSANTFTGHEGFDEGVNALLDSASGVFIAPRLYASVFRSTLAMTGTPDAIKLFSMRNEPSSADGNLMKSFYQYRLKDNLRKMAGVAGWHITMLAAFTGILSGLGGDDDEMEKVLQTQLNPYSSQFLKVKSGQRVFAISPFVSYYRFMGRLAFQGLVNDGVMEDSFDMSPTMEKKTGFVDHTYDFFRYRFNPIIGGVVDAGILNRDWDNTPISKYSLFSEDFGWALLDRSAAIVKKSTVPIWGQGIWDNFQRKTYDQVLPELAIDFTGINAYTVEAYQDLEVNGYLKEKTFKLSYKDPDIPKSMDKSTQGEIKANVKREFAEWLKSEMDNGNKPSETTMKNKNKQLLRMEIKAAR